MIKSIKLSNPDIDHAWGIANSTHTLSKREYFIGTNLGNAMP